MSESLHIFHASSISEATAIITSRELDAARDRIRGLEEKIVELEQKVARSDQQIAVLTAASMQLIGRDTCTGEVTRVSDRAVRLKMDTRSVTEEFSISQEILDQRTPLQVGDTVRVHSFIEREKAVSGADVATPEELALLADDLDRIVAPTVARP